jgi:hypothetical protein
MLLLSLGLHAAMAVLFAAHLAPRFQAPPPVHYIDLRNLPVPAPRLEPLPPRPVEKKLDLPVARRRNPPAEASRKAVVETVRPAPPPARTETPPPRIEPIRPPPARAEAAVQLARPAAAELGPAPDLRSRGERTREERLPASGAVALARTGGLDLATAPAGAPRERYLDRAGGPDLPAPVRGEAVAKAPAAEFDPGPGPKLNRRVPERPPAAAAPALRLAAVAGPAAPEAAVPVPAASPRKGPASPATRLADAGTSFDYLDRVAPADLDRLHLVSLNRLRTCLDPEAEMRLRTRLASLLGRPATCRTGGVIFDFRQPESAWSLHVDIYNYEGREFHDRCAALRLAVDCCERTRR